MLRTLLVLTPLLLCISSSFSADMTAEIQKLLDVEIKTVQALSNDPTIVASVKKYNKAPPSTMTNAAWKKLTLLSPEVKSLIKSDIGKYLKSKATPVITEMFLNGADGGKVAFLSKTSSWNHKGKAKHDTPMSGAIWTGPVEVDESSGAQQVQVAFPVLDGDTPIGSLVIGFGIAQMKEKQGN